MQYVIFCDWLISNELFYVLLVLFCGNKYNVKSNSYQMFKCTVLLTICTENSSLELFHFALKALYQLNSNSWLLSPPSPCKPTYSSLLLSLTTINNLMKVKSWIICPSVTALFYLAKCPQCSFMLSHIVDIFLRLNNVLSYVHTPFILFIHLWMDI